MLREILEEDLVTILKWRNQEKMRAVMFTDHMISLEEHLKWWKKVSQSDAQQAFIFCMDNIDYGISYFFDINFANYSAHWGFYFKNLNAKNALEKLLLWQKIESESIEYVFKVLAIKTLICETFAFNKAVIKLHQRFGFIKSNQYEKIKNNKKELVIEMRLTKNGYQDQTT